MSYDVALMKHVSSAQAVAFAFNASIYLDESSHMDE